MHSNIPFRSVINEHRAIIDKIAHSPVIVDQCDRIANMMVEAFVADKKVLLCGNGGSAADAQHIACEMVGRFYRERRAVDAETLTINTSSLTAIGNDYSFERIFSRQVEAKGKSGDILIGITTSGTSKNVIAAFETAKRFGLKNICFTSDKAPSSLGDLCDIVLCIPSSCTPRIQECHIMIAHIICEYVEELIDKSS